MKAVCLFSTMYLPPLGISVSLTNWGAGCRLGRWTVTVQDCDITKCSVEKFAVDGLPWGGLVGGGRRCRNKGLFIV